VTVVDTYDPNAGRRVGELAAESGLTVRTLHHYEEIGLLVPSARSRAGHRLYGAADVERVYRIRLLRELGLSLSDIGRALDEPDWTLPEALRLHLDRVEADLVRASRLRARLAALVGNLPASGHTTIDLIELLMEMNMDTTIRDRISILVYSDIPAVHEYLTRVFGLRSGELTFDGEGRCVHGEVHAGDATIWLHPETTEFRLASPARLGASSATIAVMVDDVDEHHRRATAEDADVIYPPVDQPYGYREYSARDCEGGLWSFMKALG
jgi:MerR family transcriptional regulator, thiopeptide resistance regulator